MAVTPTKAFPKEYDRLARLCGAVDKHDLDNGLVEHPGIVRDVAEYKALADGKKSAAKLDLERVQALKILEARQAPPEAKRTVSAAKEEMPLDPEVHEAELDYIIATEDAALWGGLIDAAKSRGYSLRELSQLHQTAYYAPDSAYQRRDRDPPEKRRTRGS